MHGIYLVNSKQKKTFNYKILNLVKYYNFDIGCTSIQDFLKTSKKLNLKIFEFKTNIWDSKWLQIKKFGYNKHVLPLQLWY